MDSSTIEYYERDFEEYRRKSLAIDMGFLLRKFMDLLPAGAVILDLGCGPGRDLKIFLRAGFRAVGVDYSAKMVELARGYAPDATVIQGDARNLALPDNSADGVWCCASLVHLDEGERCAAAHEILRVARPGGVILVSVKKGEGSYVAADGRLFWLCCEEGLRRLLAPMGPDIAIEHNRGANGEEWITALGRKPVGRTHGTAITVGAALAWGRSLLKDLPDASFEAEELLQHVLHTGKHTLYGFPERPLTADEDRQFFAMLRRRRERYPLAYLVGSRGFMGLDFQVSPAVLIPRPETELIAEYAIERFKGRPVTGLDLGTGSGCLAVSLLKYLPQARMTAVDISRDALAVARENAISIGVEARLEILCGDLFAPLSPGTVFDVIVSNPPYISEEEYPHLMPEVRCEPTAALLAKDGLEFYRRILPAAPGHLKDRGLILVELGCGQLARVLEFVPDCLGVERVIPDYAGIERVLVLVKHQPE